MLYNCQIQLTKRNLNQLIQIIALFQILIKIFTISHDQRVWKNLGSFLYFHWSWFPSFGAHCSKWLKGTGFTAKLASRSFLKYNSFQWNSELFTGFRHLFESWNGISEAAGSSPSIFKTESKDPWKNGLREPDSSESQKSNDNILQDPAILNSNAMPPTLKPASIPALHEEYSLTCLFSVEKIQFKPQLKSLYMDSLT